MIISELAFKTKLKGIKHLSGQAWIDAMRVTVDDLDENTLNEIANPIIKRHQQERVSLRRRANRDHK